jgi:hypothetical protein
MFRASDIRATSSFFHLDSPVEDIEACFEVLQNGDFAFVHQVLTFNRCEKGSTWWRLSGWDANELNKVILATKYAPGLLSPEERAGLDRRVTRDHYRCLGRAVLRGRPTEYWHLHKAGSARWPAHHWHRLAFGWRERSGSDREPQRRGESRALRARD